MKPFQNEPRIAIGLVFSIEGMRKLHDYFGTKCIDIGGDGTSASGYELYTIESKLKELLEALHNDPEIRDVEVTYYKQPRNVLDGSKYDRLADHFAGPNPDRPPLSGISISEGVVKGIINKPPQDVGGKGGQQL